MTRKEMDNKNMRESKGIMEVKRIAYKVLEENSKERKEAEKMMGCSLEEMSDDQKTIMLACLTAFQGKY